MLERQRWPLPGSLTKKRDIEKLLIARELAGFKPDVFMPPPYTPQSIRRSLNNYTSRLTRSGEFHNLVQAFLPQDSSHRPDEFSLLTHHGEGMGMKRPSNIFQFDGMSNLMLFNGHPNHGCGVTAGIDFLYECSAKEGLDRSMSDENDLVINQIQGPTYSRHSEVQKVFANFRWEQLLSGVFVLWGEQAGLGRIFMLPSEYNHWSAIRNNQNGTAFLRYDVTARRLGFKRNNSNQAYCLDVGKQWRSVYETMFAIN